MISAETILKSAGKFKIALGLERIEKILALLGNPQNNYKVIHIAGTNGKGSTSKIINDILIEHFKKTERIGLFTSPHLFSYTERIKVNNENISESLFNILIFEINNFALKNNIDLTEFELICASAFYYFYIKKVDYVILEVGLGGLYDATNVIKKPLASVITTIDFDHTERLGDTIEKIAVQKAGIIKPHCPVAVNKTNLGYDVIKKTADEKKAPLMELPKVEIKFDKKNYAIVDNKKYEFNLSGSHQGLNLALALGVLKPFKIKENTLKSALKKVTWNFRLQYDPKKNILIDSAHNPSGINTLRTFLDENFKNTKKTFIFGCLKNKNYQEMLKTLIKKEDEFYFYEFNYPSTLTFEEVPKSFNAKKISTIDEIKNIIQNDKNLKIFCGSIYMLGSIFNKIEY